MEIKDDIQRLIGIVLSMGKGLVVVVWQVSGISLKPSNNKIPIIDPPYDNLQMNPSKLCIFCANF